MRRGVFLPKYRHCLYLSKIVLLWLPTLLALAALTPATVWAQEFLLEWGSAGSGDGQFNAPRGIALDDSGNVYVADSGNNRIQKFDRNGNFLLKWGTAGTENGQFNTPVDVAVDTSGNVFVVDQGNDRIQRFEPSGVYLLKWGSEGADSGEFNAPNGITADTLGFVYVADSGNDRIQKFGLTGNFIRRWGSSGTNFGQLAAPADVAVDDSAFVYVVDRDNHRIQKFETNAVFALKWGAQGSEDIRFESPRGITVDKGSRIYVADENNQRIQRFDTGGKFQLKWGSPGSGAGEFNQPTSIAVNRTNEVYVLDSGNNRVQKFLLNATPVALADTVSGSGGFAFAITLAGTDGDADSISAVISSLPVAGQLFQTSDGTTQGAEIETVPTAVSDSLQRVIFVSSATSSGQPYSWFDFRMDDGVAQSEENRVLIDITSNNGAPSVAANLTLFLNEGATAEILNGNLRVLDPEELTKDITLRVITQPRHGRLNRSVFTQDDVDQGKVSYIHDGAEADSDSIGFRVEDRQGGLAWFTFHISVRPVNDRPDLVDPDDRQVDEGQFLTIVLDVRDDDSSELNYVIDPTPEGLTLQDNVLSWLPTYEQAGIYGIRIDVDDGAGGTDFITMRITVNDAAPPALVSGDLMLDFGAVDAGTTVQGTLTYVNPLQFPLTIETLASAAPEFSVASPAAPFTLAALDSVVVTVNFTPVFGVSEGVQGTLNGSSNFGALTIPLAGSSLWTDPAVDVEALNFGAVPVGGIQQLTFKVSTVGTKPLVIGTIASSDPQFVADVDSLKLESGEEATVRVVFSPTREGQVGAVLSLTSADTVLEVALNGQGGQPFEGGIVLDFILRDGDQGQRRAGGARPGRLYDLQLYMEGSPEIAGLSLRLDADAEALAYVEGSVRPGDFLPDAQVQVDAQADFINFDMTAAEATPSASGDGVLATLTLEVQEGFVEESTWVLSSFVLHLPGGGTIAGNSALAATVTSEVAAGFIAADFDQDGVVGFSDFFLFADVFGQQVPPTPVRYNLVDDSQIGFADFFAFADFFGQSGGETAKLLALAEEVLGLPRFFELRPNYPNPFNPETTLEYVLPETAPVHLAIYNIAGQRLRELVREVQEVGVYRVKWDGRDALGRAVGNGLYLGRLQAGALQQTQKLILLK